MRSSAVHRLALVPLQGLVITGSAADSFAQEVWIMKLKKSLAAAAERRQRILAICFGHQLMSIVLGGMTGAAAPHSAPCHPAVLQPASAPGASCLHRHLARSACLLQSCSRPPFCWLAIHMWQHAHYSWQAPRQHHAASQLVDTRALHVVIHGAGHLMCVNGWACGPTSVQHLHSRGLWLDRLHSQTCVHHNLP